MTAQLLRGALLFLAAFAAGVINAVAGGGTLVTFPALLAAGLAPIAANATSTVALVPGSLGAFWSYRGQIGGERRLMRVLVLPSLVGGALGAFLLGRVGDAAFARIVPWLVFGATGLFMAQSWIRRRLGASDDDEAEGIDAPARLAALAFWQFAVAIYGGFFGAGIGILMLAALGLFGLRNIHRMNGLKNLAAVCINGVAAASFLFQGRVNLPLAGLMAAGGIAGGYGGAGLAQKLGQDAVRRAVMVIGLAMGVYLLLR